MAAVLLEVESSTALEDRRTAFREIVTKYPFAAANESPGEPVGVGPRFLTQ
jgi:hypothetical protein